MLPTSFLTTLFIVGMNVVIGLDDKLTTQSIEAICSKDQKFSFGIRQDAIQNVNILGKKAYSLNDFVFSQESVRNPSSLYSRFCRDKEQTLFQKRLAYTLGYMVDAQAGLNTVLRLGTFAKYPADNPYCYPSKGFACTWDRVDRTLMVVDFDKEASSQLAFWPFDRFARLDLTLIRKKIITEINWFVRRENKQCKQPGQSCSANPSQDNPFRCCSGDDDCVLTEFGRRCM